MPRSSAMKSAPLQCRCGQVQLTATGPPILVSECLCRSCREAAARLATLPGATGMLTPYGATACAEYRKDRVAVPAGAAHLAAFRLSASAGTRRIVATCCHTPIFMELKGAHWLSMYLHLWPARIRPAVQLRTMVGDLPDPSALPQDMPNLATHSVMFYLKLLGAWIAMRLRNPKIAVHRRLDA